MAVRLGESASRAGRRVSRGVEQGTSAYSFAHVLVGQEPMLAMGQGLLPGRTRFGGVVGESCRGGAVALAFVEPARQEDFVHLVVEVSGGSRGRFHEVFSGTSKVIVGARTRRTVFP